MGSIVIFYACYLLCLVLGLAAVVCVCMWSSRFSGGFAWDGSAHQFNWHPVLMVTGLVVVYGIGGLLIKAHFDFCFSLVFFLVNNVMTYCWFLWDLVYN